MRFQTALQTIAVAAAITSLAFVHVGQDDNSAPQTWTGNADHEDRSDQLAQVPPPTMLGTAGEFSIPYLGNSPSLAWSPSGSQLVFTQSRMDFVDATFGRPRPPETMGVFTLDVTTWEVARVAESPGFHAGFLDEDHVVFGCGGYYSCDPGLFMTDAGAAIKLRAGEINNVAVTPTAEILFHTWERGWVTRTDAGLMTPVDPSSTDHWMSANVLPAVATDQCLQAVGDARVWAVESDGYYYQSGVNPPVRLASDGVYLYQGWAVIEPCLSPDGRFVAFIGAADLHVMPVP